MARVQGTNVKHDEVDKAKANANKPPITLLPLRVLEGVARVMQFGNTKYVRHNWRKGFNFSLVLDAAMRHQIAYIEGENDDPESGENHLDHAICCLMFIREFERTGKGEDDRYKGDVK